MAIDNQTCQTENIAAYVDGELAPDQRAAFEEHIKQCTNCASELLAQRLFMCELDSVLAPPFDLAVPPNFAQVVAVRAESDMRGVRSRAEHRRALRFCIILGLASFALLGVAASKAVILSLSSGIEKIFGVVAVFARATFDAAAGVTVISRVVSRGLVPDSLVVGLTGLILVVLAIAVLSFLISRYHRTRVID